MRTSSHKAPDAEGYIRLAASDGGLWDVPSRNVHVALERDAGARTLPPENRSALPLTPEDKALLWQMGVASE